jgi:hypothetical protein
MTRCGIALPLILLLALPAAARDHGQFGATDPAISQWFRSLRSVGGAWCCDQADGSRVEDPNWRIEQDGTYSVRLDGDWQRMPPNAIVTATNRVGFAVAWTYLVDGHQVARCFMPGTTS